MKRKVNGEEHRQNFGLRSIIELVNTAY